MTTLHIDFETRSVVDLKKCGVYVYAEHPSTDIWCAAWSIDDGPINLSVPTGKEWPIPAQIAEIIFRSGNIVAHNANFERIIWKHVLTPRYGWPEPTLTQWRCTMAMALAMSLPASLENAAAAVGLPFRKDMDGHGTMMRMAKPRRSRKGESPTGVYWFDDDERKTKLYDYCINDVRVERELAKRLLPLRPAEQRLWWLDQVINDRGVCVDVELCNAAKKVVDQAAQWLDDEMAAITSGAVSACSNVGEIVAWLRRNGLPDTDSIAKDKIDDLLVRSDLAQPVRRVLELRREAAKASVAKIDALLAGRSRGNRARGLLQYHAASTGRWAGRRFQPQNIKRPDLDEAEAIAAVSSGSAERVRMLHGEPLAVVGDCLRGMVRAAPGRKIVAADLSNIEGRVTAWVSGEEWKIQAFRDFDAGTGPDIYNLAYARSFGVPVGTLTKDSPERQVGKVMELALGFGGGVGALQKMAQAYSVEVDDFTADTWKVAWREAHPRIKQTWYDFENAAVEAVRNPGRIVDCGKVTFRKAGSFLFLRLPSGRCLCYPYPRLEDVSAPWGGVKQAVVYKGVDSYTRKWDDCYTYGGYWMENVAQAIARDVLAEALPKIEQAGYPIILTVHDEAVAEPSAAHGSVAEFSRILTEVPSWAAGLPVAADGFEGERYRKK